MILRVFVLSDFKEAFTKLKKLFDRIKLLMLNPFSRFLVKLKTLLKVCIFGLNFLSNLAKEEEYSPFTPLVMREKKEHAESVKSVSAT